jgi:NAD(P)-dependent dehydrogenase (short-subunit alcohol dehydrogenase family)
MPSEHATGEPGPSYPDLAGKPAIVTGTSRGIGCGIAEVLGRQGMKLVLAARSADAGEAFAEELRSRGIECQFVAADLSGPEGAQALTDAALGRFGRIHLLVNNAALLWSRPILELDEEAYHRSFEGNVRMVYGPSFLAARHMAEAGGGTIIHISSVGGLRAHRGLAGYDASKGAIDALTRSMALDLAPHGIRVNTVAPGLTQKRPRESRGGHFASGAAAYVPLQRPGTPEDIGHAVAFLASEAASYITGQVIYVDGGLTAQLSPPGIRV